MRIATYNVNGINGAAAQSAGVAERGRAGHRLPSGAEGAR